MEGQELWYFLFGGGGKKLRVALQCIFGVGINVLYVEKDPYTRVTDQLSDTPHYRTAA